MRCRAHNRASDALISLGALMFYKLSDGTTGEVRLSTPPLLQSDVSYENVGTLP